MRISFKRMILTTILAVLFVIVFGWVIMMQNHAALLKNDIGNETMKQEIATRTLQDITSNWRTMERRITDRYLVDAALTALALRNIITENGDEAVAMYSNGAVIKLEEGNIEAPEGAGRKLGLTSELFENRKGLFPAPLNEDTLVVYSQISGPYYYIEWHEDTSIQKETEGALDIPGILRRVETAYGVYALCTGEDFSEENGQKVLYCSEIISDLEEEFRKTGMPDLSAFDTEESVSSESGTMTLGDASFRYIKSPVPEIRGYLVLLSIQKNLYVKALGRGTYMFTALILFLAALLTTGFSLYFYIRNNDLTTAQEKRYRPYNVRRFASLFGIIGAVLILLSGMLIYALNGLYDDTARGKERLRTLENSLDMYSERVKQNKDRFMDIYLDYGTHIAEALNNYPELREQAVLETLAESISAADITLYDAKGNETLSSGEYIGLSLGRSKDSGSSDFRRILHGVPYIVHGEETDEVTGENRIRVAMRINDTEDPSRYGVMMICLDPALLEFDLSQMTDAVLQNLSGEDVILCIADQKTGRILSSSREELVDRDISAFGLNDSELQGSIIKNVETDTGNMYITAEVLESSDLKDGKEAAEDLIACYATLKDPDSSGMIASSLTDCLLFLVIYVILAWLVFGPYTDEYYELNKKTGCITEDQRKDWSGVRKYISSIRPERIGLITMEIIIGLYLIQEIPVSNFDTALSRNSVYYYLTSGNWEKGLNLFAVSGILILLGQILMIVILLRLLIAVISTFVGSKGKTICRLIRSLIMYLALFTFVILALTYVGISMSAILAAIATLGIAVSLGAQHFVSDIIAGLTMVFEGTVHVGDIVDLGLGAKLYHGEVREIGLRFIRLQTLDGNIVTLSNRDINMTTNMTRLNSHCRCEVMISSEYSVEEIEEMLRKELPEISGKDERILNGPVYNGIIALGMGTMTLLVTAECREQDVSDVQLVLNREVQRIFTKNGYAL